MTGIYNVRNYERFGVLPRNQTTFANVLRDAGYKTCVVGKWQLGPEADSPDHFGFDQHCLWYFQHRAERYPNPGLDIDGKKVAFGDGGYGPDACSDYACKFMEDNRDKPFLLYYPMILTHCPFCPTPKSETWDPTSPGSKTYKGDPRYFGDMVNYMDGVVGKLVDKLEELGLRDNTLIIFTGDNGTDRPVVSMMGDKRVAGAKNKTTDGGTRVPLVVNWPGKIPGEQVSNDLVDFSDFLPTLCETANVDVPSKLKIDGRSFYPQLRGLPGTPRQWIYMWYSREGGPKGQEYTRNQRYKLYRDGRFFDIQKDDLEKQPKPDGGLSKSEREVKAMLQNALDQFSDARPASVAAAGKKKKNKK